MIPRQPADGPPGNGNAPASAEARGADTTGHYTAKHTPADRDHQGARFAVLTTKSTGVEILFGIYQTGALAAAVAARLIEVGGNAYVVEMQS